MAVTLQVGLAAARGDGLDQSRASDVEVPCEHAGGHRVGSKTPPPTQADNASV